MKRFARLDDLRPLVGEAIGESDWLTIDQARIDAFAGATGDQQWIHTDPVRAASGPYGATVAHGFLTLSLIPLFLGSAFAVAESGVGVNYGLNRVRFPSPVPVGSRLRACFRLLAMEAVDGGAQLTVEVTVQREGGDKPACVAESVLRLYR